MTNHRFLAGLVALVLVLTVFSVVRGSLSGTPTLAARPGSVAVYQRIEALTDCTAIQAEFDQAYADHEAAPAGAPGREWTVGYMDAANDRMKALGCP